MGKTMINRKTGGSLLLAIVLLLPAIAVAQNDEGPQYLAVRTVTVTAEGSATWVEQQRQLAEVHKERGDPTRHIWQEVTGDIDTFHIVTFPENFAARDDAPGGGPPMGDAQAEWVAKIGPTVASRNTVVLRRYPQHTIANAEGSEPGLSTLRYTTIAPGKSGAFNAWIGEKLVPALKKGGAEGVRFNRIVFGGNTDVWVSSNSLPNFATLDEPGPLANLSDEERAALFEGWGEMVWESDVRLVRFRDDLSHTTPNED
jgi:hypothetical protein